MFVFIELLVVCSLPASSLAARLSMSGDFAHVSIHTHTHTHTSACFFTGGAPEHLSVFQRRATPDKRPQRSGMLLVYAPLSKRRATPAAHTHTHTHHLLLWPQGPSIIKCVLRLYSAAPPFSFLRARPLALLPFGAPY